MRYQFFAIPVLDPSQAADELNSFLAQHRILTVERELVAMGTSSVWALCIGYAPRAEEALPVKKGRIDYRAVLDEDEFRVYAKLRSLRKELAERDAVPAYAVFTNEQLAAMVRQSVRTRGQLGALPGVGTSRVERYADPFLALLADTDGNPAERDPARNGREPEPHGQDESTPLG